MQYKLNDYVGGKLKFTPISNILMNDRSKDYYSEIGKYINDTLEISDIPSLSFFENKPKMKFSSIGIFFLTATLDEEALRNMFGEPIFHNEFGEGFEGEYDEETDEELEPTIKESFASYFVTVGDLNLHIGYDHRGTTIEAELGDLDSEKILKTLKFLVDIYQESFVS